MARLHLDELRDLAERGHIVGGSITVDANSRELLKRALALPSLQVPVVGEVRKCLVCALDKPWGIFNEPTGATVCADCRDTARRVEREAPPAQVVQGEVMTCPVCNAPLQALPDGPTTTVFEHIYQEHRPLADFLNVAMRDVSLMWWRVGLHTPRETPTAGWVTT